MLRVDIDILYQPTPVKRLKSALNLRCNLYLRLRVPVTYASQPALLPDLLTQEAWRQAMLFIGLARRNLYL